MDIVPEVSSQHLEFLKNSVAEMCRYNDELSSLSSKMDFGADETKRFAGPAVAGTGADDPALAAISSGLRAVKPALDIARNAVNAVNVDGKVDPAQIAENLFRAHSMALAVATQVGAWHALGQPRAAAASAAVSGWVSHLLGLLGNLASWLLSVLQTLMTPKGWSLEGGVAIGFLAGAKLRIDFG